MIVEWKTVFTKRIAKNELELWYAIADTAAALTRHSTKVKEVAMGSALFEFAAAKVRAIENEKA